MTVTLPFDETAFMTEFKLVLDRLKAAKLHDRQSIDADYQHLLDSAYDQLDEMGRRITDSRILLNLCIRRVRMAHQAIPAEVDSTFPIGTWIGHRNNDVVGRIIEVHTTAIGRFYSITTAEHDSIEIIDCMAKAIPA